MPTCPNCGNSSSWLTARSNGLCQSCYSKLDRPTKKPAQERELSMDPGTARILLSTETAPHGLNITQRHGIVSGECVLGVNALKDLMAGARDVFGGRSSTLQSALREARDTALKELRREAHDRDANAVIAISIDYSEISAVGTMLMVVATGTAATVEPANAEGGDDLQGQSH